MRREPDSSIVDQDAGASAAAPFAACHVGVVLRAVAFVHGVLAIGLAYGAGGVPEWAVRWATASAAALPATLLWLVVACATQRWLQRVAAAWQVAAGAALGAACAHVGVWPLAMLLGDAGMALGVVPVLATGAAFGGGFIAWLRQRARLALPAATTARLAELQSRIRPHFLFNTLNTAIALLRIDPRQAETVLEDLGELFRAALTHASAKSSTTLGEEVELARRYLAIEQLRFGERLQVRWDLDPRADGAKLPPLLLQPLVENAVRHGIEPASGGGEVVVRSRLRQGEVELRVENTLPGVASTPGHGIALRNVRDRLRLLHDVAATFRAGVRGARYRVVIVVPIDA